MIADASVLILFARIGRLQLLRRTIGTVEIVSAVRKEVFAKGPATPDVRAVEAAIREGWVRAVPVRGDAIGAIAERFPNLGVGEAASLACASRRGDVYMLVDERVARSASRMLGLVPVGCLGVLAKAFEKGILRTKEEEVTGAVRSLLEAGLWISPDAIETFWAGLGGRPG